LWLKHSLTTDCQTEDIKHTFIFLFLRCNKHAAEQLMEIKKKKKKKKKKEKREKEGNKVEK